MNNVSLTPIEEKHLSILKKNMGECSLFLKRDNDDFPISNIKDIALYGNGVRHTIKGGTGSGSLDIHYFDNIEEAFISRNIKVTTKEWLDKYDELFITEKKKFIKQVKLEAKEYKANAPYYAMGRNMPEWEYDISLNLNSDIAIYVLSRNQGEGHDRSAIKGDYYLTDTEIKNIKELANNAKKFLLVINASSPIDLSPILDDVHNILLLSFLGQFTSEELVSIVLGEINPSGKLSSTWGKLEDYSSNISFGDFHVTEYKEDIFVGYKDFQVHNKTPYFAFGFGKSYSNFEISEISVNQNQSTFSIFCKVKNISNYQGKEVVQLYLSKPSTKEFVNPPYELVGFSKTDEVAPNELQKVSISFNLEDFANYDESSNSYFLPSGIYKLSLGNASNNLKVVATFEIKEKIILKIVKALHNPNISTIKPSFISNYEVSDNHFVINKDDFSNREPISYKHYEEESDDFVKSLTTDQLILLSIGNIRRGLAGMVGDNCASVSGGAGETYREIKNLPTLSMADGPAGIRITKEVMRYKGRNYKISLDPIMQEVSNYIPSIAKRILGGEHHRKKKGEIIYQYTTSIPSATALAQSFNPEYLFSLGALVAEEMKQYNVDLWLAPAMNIHRHPLCGRNFEYYSEDPLLTIKSASAIVRGVQSNKGCGAVIKHYVGNNQETNRTHSNSLISPRALREIYLKVFMQVIKDSNPRGLMTSYNLVNGEHTSSSHELINDILRIECNYKGIIMTDWIKSGEKAFPISVNESQYAYKNVNAGVNLNMPGNVVDVKNIKSALKKGNITLKQLQNSASILIRNIKEMKQDLS